MHVAQLAVAQLQRICRHQFVAEGARHEAVGLPRLDPLRHDGVDLGGAGRPLAHPRVLAGRYYRAGGFGEILSQPSKFAPGGEKEGQFWLVFFPALTANVSFWAPLSLNIPDFSRYAYSQRDQMLGQALGLPTTMGLYAFIGV
ncbi:hypothetical protein B4Q13_21985, partial [Lacticaseibacillus rhamnosus]